MKKPDSHKNYLLIKISSLILVMLLITTFFAGCGYHVYEAKIGAYEYSFKYRENDQINPYGPFVKAHGLGELNYEVDSHINITANLVITKDISNAQVIQDFIASYSTNAYIKDFTTEKAIIEPIAGVDVEGVKYYYTGYTSIPVFYEGLFIAFRYKGAIFGVDFLFATKRGGTEEPFNLFHSSFEIR